MSRIIGNKFVETLYCHSCNSNQQFEWELGLEGRQVFYCPNCGHDHYRTLKNDFSNLIATIPELIVCDIEDVSTQTIEVTTRPSQTISDARWGQSVNQ